MLYTRNAFYFRKFFAKDVARDRDRDLDLNFIAPLHPDKSRFEKGFAKLIYANRDDVGKFLTSTALKVAVDDQAIYELIQNADDCKSSFFSVSFNEKYLLCINNGNAFSDQDMSAIINIAANYKEGEDIGTFGIGFKILHRLVGKENGRDAIINDYAGPIIFSWNKYFQLEKFLNGEEIKIGGYDSEKKQYSYEKDQENAWLIKILYTCFPSHLGEKVRLKDYETQETKFEENELAEMREFLKNSLVNVNLQETNNLKSGSIFFLKLGEGKYKFLRDGIDKIKSGLSYSLKFLNRLTKIYIDGEEIKEQQVIAYSKSYPLGETEFEFVNPENLNRDIKFTFAFHKYYSQSKSLRDEIIPNLYTFFSMDDERNGFSFILHCNAFAMHNSRRFLEPNSEINQRLLPIIAKDIAQYVELQKEKNRELFLSLYANLLLSNEPKSKPHINNYFFKFLKDYLHHNIPTQRSYSDSPENVKIKDTFLEVSPSDFGCSEIEWFYWNNEKMDNVLIIEARKPEKLNLDKWSIIDLIKYAVQQNKIDEINNWIKKIELETSQIFAEEKRLKGADNTQDFKRKAKPYYSLLSEINKNILKSNFEFIAKIKLFKFSDGNFYSLSEIFESGDLLFNYEKTFDVRYELQNIGFVTSVINIDSINSKGSANYSNIKELVQTKISDLHLFQKIATKVKHNNLKKGQKHKLFVALENFDGVDVEKLRDLELFKNSQGNVYPLRNLLKGDLYVPNWLFSFKIHIAEYIPELDKYLLQESEIYKALILPYWEEITKSITEFKPFYEKVVSYFNLDDKNASLSNQKFIYLNNVEGFVSANEVFYNSKFIQIPKYKYFQDAVLRLIDVKTPNIEILSFLAKAPFKIDNSDLFDNGINDNTELSLDEIKSILAFSKINNEHFFEKFFIEKQQNTFLVSSKADDVYQIRPSKEVRLFIIANLADIFKVLPFELDEDYKDEVGIIQGEKLYDLILDYVNDKDDYKEQLVDIIHYDEPKRKFLLQLTEVRLFSEKQYNNEDFEFKVLERACNINVLRSENDVQTFRDKIVIETEGEDISISVIQAKDEVVIENHKFSLSKILPDTYQNSDHLSRLISQFVVNGINKEQIENLFGIKREVEPNEIFNLFSEQNVILQNAEQLSFLLMYAKVFDGNIENFKVKTLDEKEWELKYDYYINSFSFISDDYLLKSEYSDICEIFELPVAIGNSEHQILAQPYFKKNTFICPNIKSTLSDEEKLDFLDFIFNKYKNIRTQFTKDVDWTKINGIDTNILLGFSPNHSVFPNQYACESEVLPDYLIKWIGKEENKIDFLSDLGVWTENSVIVELRKFLKGGSKEFHNNRIAQETRFNEDETTLFNSFVWLKENELTLKTAEQFETFKKAVDVISDNRTNTGNLEIQVVFDFQKLAENSTEWEESYYENWRVESDVSIFLYEGELPKSISLDEIEDFVFYYFYEGNTAIYEKNNIYINQNSDVKKELRKLELENDDYNFDGLWQNKLDVLEKENAQLRRANEATLGTEFSTDISINDQAEALRIAKEIVKGKLEDEGFEFRNGIGEFSVISGVFKENKEHPLVVKSYVYTDAPLKINPIEWKHLMKNNSMFWLHFGNRRLGCLKINELVRNQDKLTISFSTENLDVEDRLEKFAELLHYFGNVHFDFNSIKPSDYSIAKDLSDYRFDERRNEEDLSGDDENLL